MEKYQKGLQVAIDVLAWLLALARAILELVDCDTREGEDRTPLPRVNFQEDDMPF